MVGSDQISAACWDGKHHRCTGWMVIPDQSNRARRSPTDRSVRCWCRECQHPHVPPNQHLLETPQREATYGVH